MVLNRYEETAIPNRKLPDKWKTQTALDELSDFLQYNWEQRSSFYNDEKISTKQQFLSFGGQQSIRTNNYVGTIVFQGEQLNIFPKVFKTSKDDTETDELSTDHLMKNLVRWLEYCNKVEYPYISIAGELEDSQNLKELFETLFLHFLKRAVDLSPFYRYENKNEDISVIRGRLNYKDYFTNKIPNGNANKFRCSYSEFEFDNRINQILKYTCKIIVPGLSPKNLKIARNILSKLNGVSDVRCIPADCDGFRLSKLQNRYSILISMSKMFLLNKETSYKMDDSQTFCFLFPTELLFEGFIGGFIKDTLKDEAKVTLQASDMSVFSDIVYGDESLGQGLKMRHDILIDHKDKGLFILDTKYKMLSRFEGNENLKETIVSEVTSADIYQMLTYAHTRGVQNVYLLYPLFRYEDLEPVNPYGVNDSIMGLGNIKVHLIRLPFIFEDNIDSVKQNLRKVINQII